MVRGELEQTKEVCDEGRGRGEGVRVERREKGEKKEGKDVLARCMAGNMRRLGGLGLAYQGL